MNGQQTRTAEHQCCACFTQNNLPCCNAGHPRVPDSADKEKE